MNKKTEMIVIVDDRLWKSIVRDVTSTLSLFAMVGMGVYLQSSALQWIGGILWCLWVIDKISSARSNGHMTISQARERLDELEKVQ